MNKKRLSVVMAGAMLASSVAPVLAAESYEVNGSNRGTLVKELRELLTSKVYSNIKDNTVESYNYAGQSVYKVEMTVNGQLKKFYIPTTELNDANNIAAMEDAINEAPVGTEIKVYDRGHVEKDNYIYAGAIEKSETYEIFTADQLKAIADEFEDNATTARKKYKAVYDAKYDSSKKALTVEYRKAKDELSLESIVYIAGADRVDFTKPVDGNDKEIDVTKDDWSGVAGFAKVVDDVVEVDDKIPAKLLATVTISDADTKEVVKLSDLYDGLLLTDKGQELLVALKEFKETGVLKEGNVDSLVTSKNGIFTFNIEFKTYSAKKDGTRDKLIEKNIVTVSSNNKGQLDLFRRWMYNRKPQVDVLAGDTRYETAVKVAKENADITSVAKNGNIVLVNGDALVDGLAAAPLAASVWNKDTAYDGNEAGHTTDNIKAEVAPILLTETNSIPKATRDYIKELIGRQEIQHLDKVTVYLVGGESVISKSLENELKELGLRVVRAGGANREETSLKVAEVMLKDGDNSVDVENPFIVGANGEADAMSIAPVAAGGATTVKRVRPIIVESPKGLSEDALDKLKDCKNDKYDTKAISATIVGGKTVVSEATEEMLKDAKVVVDRVEGANRQATNAAVINRYYKDAAVKELVVSKDGVARRDDLIDALTATSLAVKDNAPIVLGTDKLTELQINALNRKATREGVYVYQVGIGVARDVLKTIADRVGLAK